MSDYKDFLSKDKLEVLLSGGVSLIRFVGLLGAGMLPLAKLAKACGYSVSGSDLRIVEDSVIDGMKVGPHRAEDVQGCELLVVSFAIPENNPELREAIKEGIPVVQRPIFLGALMPAYKHRIGVSGSHGKSTTTALIDRIFCDCGYTPTTVSGARLYDGLDFRLGDNEYLIYEACEYRDAFLSFFPTVQIITSIELDHTDYFDSEDAIRASFYKCASGAKDFVIVNTDFSGASDFIVSLPKDTVTYGESHTAKYRYEILGESKDGMAVRIFKDGSELLSVRCVLFGRYNAANITAAVALADSFGICIDSICRSVSDFCGIERRMSRLGTLFDLDVFYDYAHHPTEISAATDAVNARYGECTVVFCPHTYTRTKTLWNDFITALSKAHFTILLDIYPAREEPIEGVTSENLAKAMGGGCVYAKLEEVISLLKEHAKGAIVLMGAGDMSALVSEIERTQKTYKQKEI